MSEFEEYLKNHCDYPDFTPSELIYMKQVWNARQEEIDELKAQLEVKHSAPSQKTHFEDMIRQSPDFETLLNIHGERLFIKHELSYAVLAMRSAYWAWLWVHTLYKDISEMCDEIVADVGDVGAEIKKLKAEKAGLEGRIEVALNFANFSSEISIGAFVELNKTLRGES